MSGFIQTEDILEQIIGKPIMDEFDTYEDLRAVAQLEADKERKDHPVPPPEPAKETPPEPQPPEKS